MKRSDTSGNQPSIGSKRNAGANATNQTSKNATKNVRKPWANTTNQAVAATASKTVGGAGEGPAAFIEADAATDSFYSHTNVVNNTGGERVKVAVRCRPLLQHELSRND